jgi:serine/threonine protein kinase
MKLGDQTLRHLRAVADLPDLSGTKYQLIRALGRGGMGTVYLANDTELGRHVALKVVRDAGIDAHARIEREARVLATLEHPGIVPIHDMGLLPDGRRYYAMKFVRGERLDAHLSHQRTLPARLQLFDRICDAVAFAHARNIVHLDLKPENIMVGEFGEVLVLDWGIARMLVSDDNGGAVMGTPGYMSPEQSRGERADARADIHALGHVLHRIVPDPAAPRALAAIWTKAASADVSARYQSLSDMTADLERFRDGLPVGAHAENPLERVARVVSRYRVPIALVAAYVLMRILLILLPD